MANTNNVPVSKKSNKSTIIKTVVAILAVQAVAAGLFFAGIRYEQNQTAAKKAAVQDALKAINAPAVASIPKTRGHPDAGYNTGPDSNTKPTTGTRRQHERVRG